MKKKVTKLVLALLSLTLVVCACTLAVFAEDANDAEVMPDFTVTDKDGNERVELSGSGEEALVAAMSSLLDGDTVKLNRDLQISAAIYIKSEQESPRVINFDLGGHMIYSLQKITAFSAGDYTTYNIYSSAPGGYIYITNVENTSYGGNVFNIMGDSAVINAGEVTLGDVTYPGENLSTFSSCVIDLYPLVNGNSFYKLCDSNSYFNLTGGYHFSICSDYSGFIIPRCGEATFNIKDANFIMFETRPPINSAGTDTTLNMENCRLIQAEGKSVALFNSAFGKVNLKDCVTSYSIKASSSAENCLTLEGTNVFSKGTTFEQSIIKSSDELVLARTSSEYELVYGGRDVHYFDKTGQFTALSETLPKIPDACIVTTEENTVTCRFVSGKDEKTEIWCKGQTPEYPFDLPREKLAGMYKYGWRKSVNENGVVVYTAGLVADFDIKISVVYDTHLYFNIFVPAFIFDDGYLDYLGVTIDGMDFPMSDWEKREVDGEFYYAAYTNYLDEETALNDISVFIPCDFSGNKRAETTWEINLTEYVERVLATEADAIYTEDEYALVHAVKTAFLSE